MHEKDENNKRDERYEKQRHYSRFLEARFPRTRIIETECESDTEHQDAYNQ